MRKNGFTLIELLAVIVILAIIALIATPIILGIINDAREKANERSVELYASAVRNGIAVYQLREGKEILPKTYTKDTLPFEVEYDGEVECSEIIISDDSKVSLKGCTVNGGDKPYNYGIGEQEDQSELAKLCTPNTEKAKVLLWQSGPPNQESSYAEEEVGLLASDGDAYAKGVAYTCNFGETEDSKNLTFFVLSSTETDVTLISGSNLGGTVAWSEDGSNHKDDPEEMQAVTAKAALADRTLGWNKLTDEQKATIKLPTEDQITSAYEETMPKWLNGNITEYNGNKGYWTSTPYVENTFIARYVLSSGGMNGSRVDEVICGVRPVITLLKS